MQNKLQHGDGFSVTATHATAAVATKDGVASTQHYITTVTVASDKAGAVGLIKQGTTVLWAIILAANTSHTVNFNPALSSAVGALVSAEVDGTAVCKANIAGYTIKVS